MKQSLDVIIEKDVDGYYIATVPSLPGCHTQAKSLDTLMVRAKEAIQLYLEVNKDSLKKAKTQFVGMQMIEVNA